MAAASLSELPGWARELLERSPRAHLSYLDDRDRPRVLPVTFALSGEDVWTAIDQKPKSQPAERSARVRYLRRRPEAALCVDRYHDDWSRLAWVQMLVEATVLEEERESPGARAALQALRAKYDAYADDPPRGPVIRLRPRRVLCWRAAGD